MDKLVSSKLAENLRMAKKLSNNSRYIDDIGVCNMNNHNGYFPVIGPPLISDITPCARRTRGGPGGGAPALQVHGVQGGSRGLPPVW